MPMFRALLLSILMSIGVEVAAATIIKVPAVLNVSEQTPCVQNPGTVYGKQDERQRVRKACLPVSGLLARQDEKGMVTLAAIREIWTSLAPDIEVVGNDRIQLIQSKPQSVADLKLQARQWLEQKLQKRFEAVVVEQDNAIVSVLVSDTLQWQVRESEFYPKRRQCVWMDGARDGQVRKSLPVCFRVQATAQVPVYNLDLAANDELDFRLLGRQMVEVTSLAGIPAELVHGVRYVTTGPVKSGAVLLAIDVRARPDVVQGKPVSILSQVGGVEIIANGIALEEGQIGDVIRVKADKGDEPFTARVEGIDKVKIGGDV
jgi:flagella basal body P-ring formation protein FlgA